MALFTSVNPQLAANGDGSFSLTVGAVTWNIQRGDAVSMVRAERRDLAFLMAQIALGLDAAGFTPAGKTDAQVVAAVNALTIKI